MTRTNRTQLRHCSHCTGRHPRPDDLGTVHVCVVPEHAGAEMADSSGVHLHYSGSTYRLYRHTSTGGVE